MDRFLMHVFVGYPDEKSEQEIMLLVRGEEQLPRTSSAPAADLVAQEAVFTAREEIHRIQMSDAVAKYIVALTTATRNPGLYRDELKKWIQVGASPRGTIGLDKCSRAYAWLQRREFVRPDDVAGGCSRRTSSPADLDL
jgi:MoxR-like ATPase